MKTREVEWNLLVARFVERVMCACGFVCESESRPWWLASNSVSGTRQARYGINLG